MIHWYADFLATLAAQVTIVLLAFAKRPIPRLCRWGLVVCAVIILGVRAASSQTLPQPSQPPPAAVLPVDQPYAQLDADLHALVASINARLAAVTEDMNQLQERLNAMRPKPQALPPPPVAGDASKPGGTGGPEPLSRGEMPLHNSSPQNEQNGPR